jgi:hypothetical protein
MKKALIILPAAILLSIMAGCGAAPSPKETWDETSGNSGTPPQTSSYQESESSPELPGTTATEPEPTNTTASTTDAPNTTANTTASTTVAEPPPAGYEKPVTINNVLLYGTSAMEPFHMAKSGMTAYANSISAVKAYLPDVNVYAMFVPISVEFNLPQKYKNGISSQLEAMNFWYLQMAENVITVDTWTELNNHKDEYLYFRTDHHWTQRGAYYAYAAFAKAAGFEPHEISDYNQGSTKGFLGYLYTVTKSSVLKNNPDSVEYFMPINQSKMTVYSSPAMTNGTTYPVISSPRANYLMFLAGDNPLCHIVSDTVKNGKILLVTKDSFGNALIPFLTDHFEQIFVIDQRYFNKSQAPSLKIVDFAKKHGVTDILCQANAFNSVNGNTYFKKLLP